MSEPVELAIADILRLEDWQVRRKLDDDAINRYAARYACGEPLPPIEVAEVDLGGPSTALVVTDGWHRIAALEKLGRGTVEGNLTAMSADAARWKAAKANLAHGVPLKRSEYRAVFRSYVESGQHMRTPKRLKSYRQMEADLAGIATFSAIRKWMVKDFPRIAAAMGGNDDRGGRREAPETDPSAALLAAARRSVSEVAAAAEALPSPDHRGELIAALEEALGYLRSLPHVLPDPNPDF